MNTKGIQIGAIAVTGMLALLAPAGAQQSWSTSSSVNSSSADNMMNKPMNSAMNRPMDNVPSPSGVSGADRSFIRTAAEGGRMEVNLGQMAVNQASDPDVKAFGQRMVDDHTKANTKLQEIATSKGVTVASDRGAEEKGAESRLQKLSGAAFDKAYVGMMVRDHRKDVAEFKRESEKAADTDVRSFAADTLPTLEDHLKTVQALQSKIDGYGMGHRGSAAHSNMENGTGSLDSHRQGLPPTDTPPPPRR